MSLDKFTEYKIEQNAYAAFDALSMQQLLIDRLRATTNLTDQDFEGSNAQGIIDIVAQTYHTLLFYLNQSSSENLLSQAQIWENMNRVVSGLDFKPVGYRSPIVNVHITNSGENEVNVPLYSYVTTGDTQWNLSNNIAIKAGNIFQTLLYEGKWREYPKQEALGITNEIINIALVDILGANANLIDHNNIHVYVKGSDDVWRVWKEVESFYESNKNDRHYTKRLNERGLYDITFGNNVNGNTLNVGSTVKIMYLESSGKSIKAGDIANLKLNVFRTDDIVDIIADTGILVSDQVDLDLLSSTNKTPSTTIQTPQDVDTIRELAPKILSTQKRVVTLSDIEAVLENEFSHILKSFQVVSNKELDDIVSAYYNTDYKDVIDNVTSIYNQSLFSSSCAFSNVYVFGGSGQYINNESIRVSDSAKQLIVDKFEKLKSPTMNIVIMDPVDLSLDLFTSKSMNDISDVDDTIIVIKRDRSIQVDVNEIRSNAVGVISKYLAVDECGIGGEIDLLKMNSEINNLQGVKSISIRYISPDNNIIESEGLSFVIWDKNNPKFKSQILTRNIKLEKFQQVQFNNIDNLTSRIIIE
tara:strand:- start:5170 stop:6921 length:1752 start_codon:yes stop_codon:yes gene_type:complete